MLFSFFDIFLVVGCFDFLVSFFGVDFFDFYFAFYLILYISTNIPFL